MLVHQDLPQTGESPNRKKGGRHGH
jgi:hypothetical protein